MTSSAHFAERLFYDEDSGLIVWRSRSGNDHYTRGWNKKFAGKVAGCIKATGYVHVAIDNRLYQAHRVIWEICNGEMPAPWPL